MSDTPWDSKPAVPADFDTEVMTLGCALAEPEAAEYVVEELDEEDFHLSAHRRIYQAIHAVFTDTGAADHIEVAAWLRDRNDLDDCGGLEYLGRAMMEFHTTAHVTRYADILRTLRVRREAMEMAGAFYTRFRELQGDPTDSIEHFLTRFEQLDDLARGGAPLVGLDAVAEQLGTIR
ncbi:MAG: DnaB-like helicase N-terminal domain-containing protein, partial [Armatimonadota bacterium]